MAKNWNYKRAEFKLYTHIKHQLDQVREAVRLTISAIVSDAIAEYLKAYCKRGDGEWSYERALPEASELEFEHQIFVELPLNDFQILRISAHMADVSMYRIMNDVLSWYFGKYVKVKGDDIEFTKTWKTDIESTRENFDSLLAEVYNGFIRMNPNANGMPVSDLFESLPLPVDEISERLQDMPNILIQNPTNRGEQPPPESTIEKRGRHYSHFKMVSL